MLLVASLGTQPISARSNDVSAALNVIPDPGPPPAFNASEYRGYRSGSGSSVIVGRFVSRESGWSAGETCEGSDAILYPNTAYTRWMIATWVRLLDGRRIDFGILYPGASETNIPVPKFLQPAYMTDDPDDNALQLGRCDGSNNISFANVPAGNYIFVMKVEREIPGVTNRPGGNIIVQTPNGEYPVPTYDGPTRGGHLGDGYVMVTREAMVVKAGRSYTMVPANMYPAAHFLERAH